MSHQEEVDRLLQTEWRERVIPEMHKQQWLRVYQLSDFGKQELLYIYCGLAPKDSLPEILSSHEWNTDFGRFSPSFTSVLDKDEVSWSFEYDRFDRNDLGIEPLIVTRNFQGIRPRSFEVVEEFRLFHNLYCEASEKKLVKFDDVGDAVDVVRIYDNYAEVRRKEIRQFLAAKRMSLVVYYDRKYFSSQNMESLGIDEGESIYQGDDFIFRFYALKYPEYSPKGYKAVSNVVGKTIIDGLPLEKSGLWPFEEEIKKEYEEFIIDIDEDDEAILVTSDPYYENERYFLRPVYFKREVLDKYYSEPSKYAVEDRILRCGHLWSLYMDNSHPDYVIAYLGDLGGDLPTKEQKHWKHYNVAPDGWMSKSYYRQSILAEFVGPDDSAFQLKNAYEKLKDAWNQKFAWHLFKPLSEVDSHHYSKLRRPLTKEPSEFHEIVLSLSILLQDRINKKELGKLIPAFQKKDADKKAKQNIPVLAEFLVSEDFADANQYIEYLRMLQLLRSNSGTVHPRNEKEYQKAVKFFSLDSKSTVQVADDIFTILTEFMDSLRKHFCPEEEN